MVYLFFTTWVNNFGSFGSRIFSPWSQETSVVAAALHRLRGIFQAAEMCCVGESAPKKQPTTSEDI